MWDKMLKEGAWIGADQYLAYETGGPPELLLTRIAEYFGGALVFPEPRTQDDRISKGDASAGRSLSRRDRPR